MKSPLDLAIEALEPFAMVADFCDDTRCERGIIKADHLRNARTALAELKAMQSHQEKK